MNIENRSLFIGDNLDIMKGIDSGIIDLIYLDPPYNTKKQYKAPIGSPAEGAYFKDIWTDEDIENEWHGTVAELNEELYSMIQASEKIYDKSMKIYLMSMTIRLFEMKRILKDTGSIYLHCDPTASHYLKLVMDSIFGKDNFRNEIVWGYAPNGRAPKLRFHRKHDIILVYGKNFNNGIFNHQYTEITAETRARFTEIDENGRKYYSRKRVTPEENRAYLDQNRGRPISDCWVDIPVLIKTANEHTGYPTQKPVTLLERIIKASSNEGDIILDPFCGCATACVAAERLDRRWIGIDISESAATITKLRLDEETQQLRIDGLDPFNDVKIHYNPPIRTDLIEKNTYNLKQNKIKINPKKYKQELFGEQEGCCNGCGYPFYFRNMTIDHIVPQSQGGTHTKENLQLLCGACNSTKGNRSQSYLIQKLIDNNIRKENEI